jgi:hypothetical protein
VRNALSRNSRAGLSERWRSSIGRLLLLVLACACATTTPRGQDAVSSIKVFSQDSVTRDSTGKRVAALTGVVLDSASGSPLEAAEVLLRSSSVLKPYFTVTDQRGSFIIGRVEPGSYQLMIRRLGYAAHVEQRSLRASVVDTLHVRLGVFKRAPCSGMDCY